jgi:CRISPR-associated protein Csx10
MEKFKIKITPLSYFLAGSGEGSALIDADIVFHQNGFPYLPGKRIKGLLRESALEVLEMQGSSDPENPVNLLFGKADAEHAVGKLQFDNWHLDNWDTLVDELPLAKLNNKYALEARSINNYALEAGNIKKYFTAEIQQTAVDDTGIAQKRSLRNYRVLLPNGNKSIAFESCVLINKALTEEEKELIERACINLRYAGTRRNRGFGKIECRAIFDDNCTDNNPDSSTEASFTENTSTEAAVSDTLEVNIKTLSPIVLSQQKGEQNTVFTDKHISGNRLRGLLAFRYLQKNNAWNNAHNDSAFFELFLSGKVKYGNCYPNKSEPLPFNIHKFKGYEEAPIDVFRNKDDDRVTKQIGGLGKYTNGIDEEKASVSFNFHNSRLERRAGKSTEDNPGIFYYESIDEGQTFTGEVSGPNELMEKLMDEQIIGSSFQSRIGRSKSVQYGKVEVALDYLGNSATTIGSADHHLLICLSPLILLNENGYPEATLKALKNYIEIDECEKAATRTIAVEQYNSTWQSKSGKIPAFQEGSVFLLKFETEVDLSEIQKNGLGEMKGQGFGKIKIIPYSEDDFPKTFERSKEDDNGGDYNIKGNIKTINPTNPILSKIIKDYKNDQKELELRSKAAERAKDYARLTNSLIGRLLRYVEASNNYEEIKTHLDNMETKTAGEKIKEKDGLWEKLYEFQSPDNSNDWLLRQLYWKNLLITARKIKDKKDGQ